MAGQTPAALSNNKRGLLLWKKFGNPWLALKQGMK